MSKAIYLFTALIVISLNSCISINGSFQGLYSYYGPMKEKNPALFVEDSTIAFCNLKQAKEPKVYITNGIRLRECISPDKNVVCYIWKPKCKSPVCYALNALQRKCSEAGADLFIVAEYYDTDLMNLNYDIERPILGIDTKYYGSNLTDKYVSRFVADLTQTKDISANLMYFKNGKLLRTHNNIDSLLITNDVAIRTH